MDSTPPGRRKFLKNSAALAGLVVASPTVARTLGQTGHASVSDMNAIENVLYGQRSRFVTTVRFIEGPSHSDVPRPRPNPYRPSARTPLGESMGIITATSLHFTTQHFYGIPDINPAEHKLMIHG